MPLHSSIAATYFDNLTINKPFNPTVLKRRATKLWGNAVSRKFTFIDHSAIQFTAVPGQPRHNINFIVKVLNDKKTIVLAGIRPIVCSYRRILNLPE